MENWYKVTLPVNEAGPGGKMMRLQDEFREIFLHSGPERDAALFTDKNEDFTEHYFYFSPGAARIALQLIVQYGGVECSHPTMTGTLRLVVGHADARDPTP